MSVKRTHAWGSLLLCGGLLLLGCQTETASSRDEHVAATVGSAQTTSPKVLPNGLDPLNLPPDLKLAEQQIFLLTNTIPLLVVAVLVTACNQSNPPSQKAQASDSMLPSDGPPAMAVESHLPPGIDPLALPPDLQIAEQQTFFFAGLPRSWWDAYACREGAAPVDLQGLLNEATVWPLNEAGQPWPVAAGTHLPALPGVGLAPASADRAWQYIFQAAPEFASQAADLQDFQLEKRLATLRAERVADTYAWYKHGVAKLLLPLTMYAVTHGRYPSKPTEAFASLRLAVGERQLERILGTYPQAAYLRSEDGQKIGLLLEGGTATPWLMQHRLNATSPGSASVSWTNDMRIISRFQQESSRWLPLSDLEVPTIRIPEDLMLPVSKSKPMNSESRPQPAARQ